MIDASVESLVLETLEPLCEKLEQLKPVTKYNEQTDMIRGILFILRGDTRLGDVQELFLKCCEISEKRVAQIFEARETDTILSATEITE